MTAPTQESFDTNIRLLANRVEDIQSTFSKFLSKSEERDAQIDARINKLAEAVQNKGQFDFKTLIQVGASIFGMVVFIWGGIYFLFSKEIEAVRNYVREVNLTVVPRAEINDKLVSFTKAIDEIKEELKDIRKNYTTREMIASAADKRDAERSMAVERFVRLENAIDDLRKSVVPRGEHEEKWRTQALTDANMSRRQDELKADISGLYSPRDAFQRMQTRLDELEREAFALRRSVLESPRR